MVNKHFDTAAIIISLATLVFTLIERYQQRKRLKESDRKAERAIKLSEGDIELTIRNMLSEARHRLNLAIKELHTFKIANPDKEIKIMEKLFYSALEDFINSYERASMLYIDEKIDRERFKREYSSEIRNLVENGEYKDKYFPAHTSKFKAILKVYDEWENLEK